jgi:hypothetical protein
MDTLMQSDRRLPIAAVAAALALTASVGVAAEGSLAMFANGEALATEGFIAPALTRDGWELRFDRVLVTVAGITALQTDPPYDAQAGGVPDAAGTVDLDTGGPVTIDLTETGEDGRVLIGSTEAPEGHYNAVAWSVVPAAAGDWAGRSMVLVGAATRDGKAVPFTLTSTDTHEYVCGEYVGDARKGFVTAGGVAELELTFHLDHVFGRADKGADDPMNQKALGFGPFASGAEQAIELAGLHIGHVGEGHCAVTYR